MKTSFYLDKRAVKKGNQAPLKILISINNTTAFLHTNIYLLSSQWNADKQRIENHDNKIFLNSFLQKKMIEIQNTILTISESVNMHLITAVDLKNKISSILNGDNDRENLFINIFNKYKNLNHRDSTIKIYNFTLFHLKKFSNGLEYLSIMDIDKNFVNNFKEYLYKNLTVTGANIHLRNLKAVLNYAIDEELITEYPFRKIKLKKGIIKHRALNIEQLRQLFNLKVSSIQQKHLDMFKLIFFLIGINSIDLYNLKKISNDGRIEYIRSKTSKQYSIKVEREALEIIEKYRGSSNLLDLSEKYQTPFRFVSTLNKSLKRLGYKDNKGITIPLFPFLSTYWARHTWATIASSLDIPKETIAHALGHGNNSVTDIYIDFNLKKVDEANRKVIDFVLYDKK